MAYSYNHHPWGEMIRGSKADLQSLGLACDLPYPGEPGGPARSLKCADPRGFPCTIEKMSEGDYLACVRLPGRDRPQTPNQVYADGVEYKAFHVADFFTGRGAALVAAGLVEDWQLPGAPGMQKTVTHLDTAGIAQPKRISTPGARTIRLVGRDQYSVRIELTSEELERRGTAYKREEDAYLAAMAALPRPAPLVAAGREALARARRATMRLAWSRPAVQVFELGRPSA